MEVIYKKTIIQKVRDAVHLAGYTGHDIEKIILEDEEWDRLGLEYDGAPWPLRHRMLFGVRIEARTK